MSEFREIMDKINKEQLVSNIERIVSSYRHPWDIYTELLQNSVDAVIEEYGYANIDSGNIKLEVFPDEYKIVLTDNGCGIESKDISRILFVGESLKRKKKTGKYGFMGFGLTFVAFQTKKLIIESTHNKKLGKRTYTDLYKFIYESGDLPESEEEKNKSDLSKKTSSDNGTKITLLFPNNIKNLSRANDFDLAFKYAKNHEVFSSLLRTKTAIGFIDSIFNPKAKVFNFELYIDNVRCEVKPEHLTYQEILQKIYPTEKRFYNINTEYPNQIKSAEKLPKETKAKYTHAFLLHGAYENIQIGEREPIKARFIIYALSKKHIGKYNNFLYKNDDTSIYQNSSLFKIDNGVWLAINGIPTGIRLDSYDHPNFLPFTVIADIQDDYISKELDAGRKGISELRKQQIVQKAKEFLDKENFLKYRTNVLNENISPGKGRGLTTLSGTNPVSDMIKKAKEKDIETKYKNKYFPPLSEQDVIALFIELIVLDEIKGYYLKMLSSNATYDGLFDYNIERSPDVILTDDNYLGISEDIFISEGISEINKEDIIIEFKYKLSSIFSDLDQKRKKISDIDILVCWDTNNDSKLEEYGYYITQKDHIDTIFYGVTHDVVGSEGTLKVIELKTVCKNLMNREFD